MMAPNNMNSCESTDLIGLDLISDRPSTKKCQSKEQTSLLINCAKLQANSICYSKSQTNVKTNEKEEWRAPQRNKSVSCLVDELLCDIYSKMEVKRRTSATTCDLSWQDSDPGKSFHNETRNLLHWKSKDRDSLKAEKSRLEKLVAEEGNKLVKHLKRKNFLLMKREAHYDVITAYIQAVSTKRREDTKMKFSLTPGAETGFSQWLDAMKMVAQLPGGMPAEFRTKLWLQLSEKHLSDQNVDWEKAEAVIFNEWTNPDDEELGVQIVKDLHRTGCSLFCGEQEHNQALLKRVLLAYARWNKNVGYCQGFNMLAALILQVMDKDEKNAVKVMIYLIEGVLPESYFANNLRGLSVDMAVFRDLLRLRLPKLSKHLEALQHDPSAGTSYEPPLTNVFTMQWFLTLFSNCLPQQTVLRVWDLVFLYGNEVLLRTALAIWGILQDRVITVESADEFYSIMGVVTREMLEFGLMDANTLVKMIAMVDPFPNELQELREKYLYNISPWTQSVQSAAKKGIRLFYSDPDDQDDTEDEDKIALATAYGVFRRRESTGRELQVSGPTLDISILKQQYAKLRQRQRQAHVIITAACSSNLPGNLTAGPSVSVNHLLMGKSALINKGRRIGPPEGAIPPPNNRKDRAEVKDLKKPKIVVSGETCNWKDVEKSKESKSQNKIHSNKKEKISFENKNNRIIVDEKTDLKTNHNRMTEEEIKKLDKEDDDDSNSSTSTELCDDEFHRISDFDSEDNSDSISYHLRGTSPKPVRFSSRTPETVQKLPSSLSDISENGGCDKDNLKEIKTCAINLINEIESKVQTLEKLKTLKDLKESNSPKVSGENCDNTTLVISPKNFNNKNSDDNILKQEPEVPIADVKIEDSNKGILMSEVTPLLEEREKVRRKSDLGLSVIKENLEMLQKFSQKTSEKVDSKNFDIEEEDKMDQKRSPSIGKNELEEIKEKFNLPLFHERDIQKSIKTESPELLRGLLVEKAISPIEKTSKTVKVNKEVNTEITFGVNEGEISTSKTKFQLQEEPKLVESEPLSRKEKSPIHETSRRSREPFLRERDKDEIKRRIETSKSDWELKMKKIAELESTTRETLNEIQARSMHRKSFHRSLDRTTKRTYLGESTVDQETSLSGGSLSKIELKSTEDSDKRKSKLSALSFDAITSRTEKLLGKAETCSSFDERSSLLELEDWKPKNSVFKSNKSFRESFGEDLKPESSSTFGSKSKEFFSSPTSPEYRPKVKYSEYLSPKKYSALDHADFKLDEEDYLRVGQNENKTAVELVKKKYSPELKSPETDIESHSNKSSFNPFPKRSQSRPKELGVKLGLYPTSPEGQSKKS